MGEYGPKFSPGDRVRVFQKLEGHWNRSGEMDHWLDQIVTIKHIIDSFGIPIYSIMEDQEERAGGWIWREDCLEFAEDANLNEGDILNILEV